MLKSVKVAGLVLAAWVLPFNAALADGFGCEHESAVAFPFFEPDTTGVGTLCVLPNRLLAKVRLSNLIAGNAYTVWWTYLDDPSLCTGETPLPVSLTGGVSNCELADFEPPPGEPNGKPLGIFGRMASGVAPRNGRLNLRGELGGMQPSSGSEIWFWILTHGAAERSDGAALARQLLTPEDPAAGAPHLGNNTDGQRGFPAATVVFKLE